MSQLLEYFKIRQEEMLKLLEVMVGIESPTLDPEAVNHLGRFVTSRLDELGAKVEIQEREVRGNNIVGRFGSGEKPPVLLIGHMDTVWKAGTLAERPFRIDGEFAYGPGTGDMKGGLVIMLYVLKAVRELGLKLPRPLTLVFNSDEEMRSEYSRDLILEEAAKSGFALIMEGSRSLDTFTTQRKATGRFWVRASGRAAHAGAAIDKGINAIEEIAHQVLALQAMTDMEIGTTVNVGVINGGDRPNIVPDWAEVQLSVRAPTEAEMQRIKAEICRLKPRMEGTKLEVTGDFHRPPLSPTPANQRLFGILQEATRAVGIEAKAVFGGGASDANLTSGAGTPSIDGMGAVGGGAHSIDEHILIESLPLRAAIVTELLTRLA